MSSHPMYGAIQQLSEGSRRRGLPLLGAARTRRAVLAVAAAGAVCCLLGLVEAMRGGGRPTVMYYHGLGDPVTWDGVGAGGTGPAYSWTAHSFSPIGRRQVSIQYTHDHSSYANYHNNGTWVVGAAQVYPVIQSRPAGWLDAEIFEGNGTNATNATGGVNGTNTTNGTESGEARASVYDYVARMFPIERGYSHNLFGAKDDASAENATAEEVEDAEEEAEGEAQEMKRLRGIDSPMVFNDLPTAPGLGGAPIQRPIFTHNPVEFGFRR